MGNRHTLTVDEMPSQGHDLDPLRPRQSDLPSGTRLAFQQLDAPSGWTKDEKASEAEPRGFIIATKD